MTRDRPELPLAVRLDGAVCPGEPAGGVGGTGVGVGGVGARFVDAVERDGLAMEFHPMHRPLDAYTRALQNAGFVIEVLHESVPDDEYVREHPRLQRQTRIPWYLHLRAVRR
jgi:hypothetical protein